MENNYSASGIEKKWQKYWEENQTYKFDPSKKDFFSIDTPPPTVSGNMHMGHAFSYSQMDFIARFWRMKKGVFYPFGTDDNGLPTERLIEKLKNVKGKNMSRNDFINLCLKTLNEITPKFIEDWKNLGISCDFSNTYSTIDDKTRKISQKYFLELHKKKLVYKKSFPTIWDVKFQTPVAQAELEDKEKKTFFTTLKFSSEGKELLIATTRPEMLGACVAVFVNPKDNRYKKLIGKKAKVPLFNYEVPIIADNSADIEKGTGAMMICSYGDKYDVDAINKHKLIPKIIINKDGTISIEPYKGLTIKETRSKILSDLKNQNFIIDQKEIIHNVNVYEKSGEEIEFLPTEQWFIKILDKKKELIKQGKKIKWHPEFMFKRYENWINGLEWDWSISRERHFGIPIPAWNCSNCNEIILPDEKDLPIDPSEKKKICPKCKKEAIPETKVFDTWITSSLTPQIASSLFNNKIEIPYSLRAQAHDIIRTWAFYTIVRSYLHENNVPWKNIMISGFVTLQGEKMSKSKGNGIEPSKIINQYGADALRFWAAVSKLGEDLDYNEKDLITGNKFLTKIWNASKFSLMNLGNYNNKKAILESFDKFFLIKLNKLVKEVTYNFEDYNFSQAKRLTDSFFWNMFCDNYLEIIKKRIYNDLGEKTQSAKFVLKKLLITILKLYAPIVPYITEEIYSNFDNKSIHLSSWPEYDKKLIDDKLEKLGDEALEVISRARKFKAENKKSLKEHVKITLSNSKLEIFKEDLESVCNADIFFGKEFKIEF